MINAIYLDIDTHDCRNIMRRLQSLKTTYRVENDGPYREDTGYSRIYLETSMTLDEVEKRYVDNGKLAIYAVCEAPKRSW